MSVNTLDKYSQMMRWLTRPQSTVQEPRIMELADGGRIGLKRGTRPDGTRYTFPTGKNNPGVKENIEKINIDLVASKNERITRFKELIKKEGKTPNEAKKIVIEEFKLNRSKKAGTPTWMAEGKIQLIEEGVNIPESKRGPENVGGKARADKKRLQVIGEGRGFETRIKRAKTPTGLGSKYQTAHTANIFQAKKLGIDYPVNALAIQSKKVNEIIAEALNDELKPLYSDQSKLVTKMKRKNTPGLQKQLDKINFQISETVATGGKQGKKAANVLKPIIVNPSTLKGKILDLGFKTSTEIMSLPGATTKGTKAGSISDLMARMNVPEQVKEAHKGPIQKLEALGCPGKAAGGRISFDIGGSTSCITRALEKLKNPTNLSPGDQANISALRKMGKGVQGAKTFGKVARLLGKAGVVGELAFGGLFALTDYASGANKEEILSNFTYGLAGKSQDEQLKEKDSLYGRTKEIIGGFTSFNDMLRRQKDKPIGRMGIKSGAVERQRSVLAEKMQPFLEGPRNEEFNYDIFARQKAKDAQSEIDFAKEKLKRQEERQGQGILAADDWGMNVDARGYAEGGIVNLRVKK